jgi:hypothetical protein
MSPRTGMDAMEMRNILHCGKQSPDSGFLTVIIIIIILSGLVIRVPGYRSRDSGSTPGATRFP